VYKVHAMEFILHTVASASNLSRQNVRRAGRHRSDSVANAGTWMHCQCNHRVAAGKIVVNRHSSAWFGVFVIGATKRTSFGRYVRPYFGAFSHNWITFPFDLGSTLVVLSRFPFGLGETGTGRCRASPDSSLLTTTDRQRGWGFGREVEIVRE
jgi:hypothetical protein